jgi:hypothetical protein
VLDTVVKSSPGLGALALFLSVIIPLSMSKIVRTSYAYRLQLLEQGASDVKSSVRALKGFEERLKDNAKSSKIRNIPAIAATLLHLNQESDARRLLIKKLGTDACKNEGFDPGEIVPILLSIPGKNAFQAVAGIYYTCSIRGRECIVQGIETFLAGLEKKAAWPEKFYISKVNIDQRIPDISTWLTRETPRAKGKLASYLARVAANLPEKEAARVILKILDSSMPVNETQGYSRNFFKLTSKHALNNAETQNLIKNKLKNEYHSSRISRILEAVPIRGFMILKENIQAQNYFKKIILKRKDGANEAVQIIKALDWSVLAPALKESVWAGAQDFHNNREFCIKGASCLLKMYSSENPAEKPNLITAELVEKNQAREKALEEIYMLFSSILSNEPSEFHSLLLNMMAKTDFDKTEKIISGFTKTGLASAKNNYLHVSALNILAEKSPEKAADLSEKLLLSPDTSQFLKKRAAITLVALKSRHKTDALEKCVLSNNLNFDSQTRSYLAQALKKLKRS